MLTRMLKLTAIVRTLEDAKAPLQWIDDGKAARHLTFLVKQALEQAEQCLSEMKTLAENEVKTEKREKRRSKQKTTVATLHQIK